MDGATGETLLPVRALVWLRLDSEGNVTEAEVSGDTSWMTLDPSMAAFFVEEEEQIDIPPEQAQELLDTLVESDKWTGADVRLEV